MEYKHTFAGISSNGDVPFDKEFDIVNEYDDETIAVSKNEYQCYLGSKTVNYRIAVRIQQGAELDPDYEGKMFVEVDLVPAFRSLHREKRDELIKFFGVDYGDGIVNYGKKDDMTYYSDAVQDGLSVTLAEEQYEYKDIADYAELETKIMNDIANTYSCMTGLSGFYLDRPTNMLGMTGWDWLRQYCNNVSMTTILKDLKKRYTNTTWDTEQTLEQNQ